MNGQIRRLAEKRNYRLFRAHLAERYDGIGRFVLVSMSRGSISSAFKAYVKTGDFITGTEFPPGTP